MWVIILIISLSLLFFIRKNVKQEMRVVSIENTIKEWVEIYNKNNVQIPDIKKIIGDFNITRSSFYSKLGGDRFNVGGEIFYFKTDDGLYTGFFHDRTRPKRVKITKNEIDKYLKEYLESQKFALSIIEKFGEERGNKLIKQQYDFDGITIEDIKFIRPLFRDAKEEQLKTKTKTYLYYDYYKSRDYYVFDDGLLVKYVN
jgi:hypothetical protein